MSYKDRIKMPKVKPSKIRNRIAVAAFQRHAGSFKDKRREAHWNDDGGIAPDENEPMQYRTWAS